MAGTQATDGTFKSPLQKLVRFFQRSRDQWKKKHHALKKDIKPIFDTVFLYPIDGEAVASTGDVFGTTRTLPRGG